jgi:hypothetical protein
MSATNAYSSPTELLSPAAETRSHASAVLEADSIRRRPICEPQIWFGRAAARPVSTARAMIELIVLALLFLGALSAIATCLTGLSHLAQS